MWINLDKKERDLLIHSLSVGMHAAPQALIEKLKDPSPERQEMIDAFQQGAVNEYGSDDIEVDGDAVISESEEGAFVMGWLWVSNEEAGMGLLEDKEEPDAED